MLDFKKVTEVGTRIKKKVGGKYLCTVALLAFVLSAGFFLSACGGSSGGNAQSMGPCYDGDVDHIITGTNPIPPDADTNYDVGDTDTLAEGKFIKGNEVNNAIHGGPGDDCIRSLGGNDLLEGREGDDELDGGAGIDTAAYYIHGRDVTVALEALDISLEDGTAANDGYGNTDTLIDIENVTCAGIFSGDTAQGATIVGDDGRNILHGCHSFAEDVIIGRGGDDVFLVTSGEDYHDGGEGTDTLDFNFSGSIDIEINLSLIETGAVPHSTGNYGKIGDNTDTLADPSYPYVTYAKLENGSSTTAGQGNTTIENIVGTGGNDTLTGDADDNRLDGGYGADTLRGGDGADTLIGTDPPPPPPGGSLIEIEDTLEGGAGDDTYYATTTDTVTENSDEGDDTLYYTGTTAITHSLTYAEFTSTTDPLPTFAPENVETIYGTSNADTIRAAAGDVTVIGGAGDDILIGGNGNNTLIGCAGDNTFYSNTGTDMLPTAPYTYPEGQICAESDPRTCGENTFVLVYSSGDTSSIIDFFTENDNIILVGFPPASGGSTATFTAAAAMVSDLETAGVPLPPGSTGTSDGWTHLKVNTDTSVAFIRVNPVDFPMDTSGTAPVLPSEVLANRLNSATASPVTVDDGTYDTGCDEIQ